MFLLQEIVLGAAHVFVGRLYGDVWQQQRETGVVGHVEFVGMLYNDGFYKVAVRVVEVESVNDEGDHSDEDKCKYGYNRPQDACFLGLSYKL